MCLTLTFILTCILTFISERNMGGAEYADRLEECEEWRCFGCDATQIAFLTTHYRRWTNYHRDIKEQQAKRAATKKPRVVLKVEDVKPTPFSGLHVDGQGRSVLTDITRGREHIAISCVNSCDKEPFPLGFIYTPRHLLSRGAYQRVNKDPRFLSCCDCEDGCRDVTKCACARLSMKLPPLVAPPLLASAASAEKGRGTGRAKAKAKVPKLAATSPANGITSGTTAHTNGSSSSSSRNGSSSSSSNGSSSSSSFGKKR